MAGSSSQAIRFSTSIPKQKKVADDWPFQGNTSSEISYEDNFDADISLLEESSANDSGYFSGENIEFAADKTADDDQGKFSYLWSTDSQQGDEFSTDTSASTKPDHGSTYDSIRNESTVTFEKGTSSCGQSKKSSKRSIIHDIDSSSTPKYSVFSGKVTSPTPLQIWVETHERHESIAYRLEQPAKRRKTTTGKQ